MKYTVYIFTYGRYELALGAARSIKNFCEHDTTIILADASQTITSGPFDKILHDYFPRWMGFALAKHIHNNGPGLCIDDDMRLISSVSLKDRYCDGNYKPYNGSMVMAWKDIETFCKTPFIELKCNRMKRGYVADFTDKTLFDLAINTKAEHIDDIWLHIDKGSEKLTEARKQLIHYIDNV